MSRFETIYQIVDQVLRKDAYVNIALGNLPDDNDKPSVTKIVYGTVEKYFELSYIINSVSEKRPKPAIMSLLLAATYALLYTDIPAYAVINECVSICDSIGKGALKGYCNGVLRNIADKKYKLPAEGDDGYEEVKYNLPRWIIDLIKNDYGNDCENILLQKPFEKEHVRLRKGVPDSVLSKMENALPVKTPTGFYVKNTPEIIQLFKKGMLTYQSFTSTLAVDAFGELKGKTFLDLCSAPGGKAVYAKEKGAFVTACDLHPHRVKLIRQYAFRMGVELRATACDAKVFNPQWEKRFDAVLLDAPCSGLGVLSKRGDAAIKKRPEDILSLAALQFELIKNAARYVKQNGILIYSTCTVAKAENGCVARKFLESAPEFKLDKIPLPYENSGEIQFLPNGEGCDGFYIARFKRK